LEQTESKLLKGATQIIRSTLADTIAELRAHSKVAKMESETFCLFTDPLRELENKEVPELLHQLRELIELIKDEEEKEEV
jgi:hypothetical protein